MLDDQRNPAHARADAHLAGELDRIVNYLRRGWIAVEPLSSTLEQAHAVLRTRV